jgi:hypothetical protein
MRIRADVFTVGFKFGEGYRLLGRLKQMERKQIGFLALAVDETTRNSRLRRETNTLLCAKGMYKRSPCEAYAKLSSHGVNDRRNHFPITDDTTRI